MTVISEPIESIAGADNTTQFVFSAIVVRESDDGTALVTTRSRPYTATGGILTTDDFDAGPAQVAIDGRPFPITIPDSETAVRLTPLILAGLPVPPTDEADAIRNLGGIAGGLVMTQTAYNALSVIDPETFYVLTSG